MNTLLNEKDYMKFQNNNMNIHIQDMEKQQLSRQGIHVIAQNLHQKHNKFRKLRIQRNCIEIVIVASIVISLVTILALYALQDNDNDDYQADYSTPPPQKLPPFIPTKLTQPSPMAPLPPSLKSSNYALSTTKLQKTLQKQLSSYQTDSKYTCTSLQQRFEQYYDNKFYVMTAYNVFLQLCTDIDKKYTVKRENVVQWNRYRARIEWVVRNVKEGDRVLLNRKMYNLLEIVIIGKIVGPKGELVIVGPHNESKCLHKNIQLHKLTNIKFVEQVQYNLNFYKKFTIILDTEKLLGKGLVESIIRNQQTKIFTYVKNPNVIIPLLQKMLIKKFTIDPYTCDDPVLSAFSAGQGFYILYREQMQKGINNVFDQKKQNQILRPFYQRYKQHKKQMINKISKRLEKLKKIRSNSLCLNISKFQQSPQYSPTIYGSYLYGVSLNQSKNWQQQREAIQWSRQSVNQANTVYYDMTELNLMAISEISKIVQYGKLIVVCRGAACSWIQRQKQFQNRKNIQMITLISQEDAMASDVIITDNENLISLMIDQGFLAKGKLLGYFTRQRQNSFRVFGKLVPDHNMRQIKLSSALEECQGFSYQNYFWDIDTMNRFYQIIPSNYRIYMYWRGSPKNLTVSRRNSLEEIIQLSKVEVKILNRQLFYLVQQQTQIPIHQGFRYLSSTHQSDYFRVYMIHNFGGAYADIKHYHFDWTPYFDKLYNNTEKYAMGYPQRLEEDIGCHQEHGPPPCSQITSKYKQLIGNGYYIYKKNTVLTKDALTRIHVDLDNKLQLLRKHPSTRLRQNYGFLPTADGKYIFSEYPMRWGEMSGEHMSRVGAAHLDLYLYDLPYIIMVDYQ